MNWSHREDEKRKHPVELAVQLAVVAIGWWSHGLVTAFFTSLDELRRTRHFRLQKT